MFVIPSSSRHVPDRISLERKIERDYLGLGEPSGAQAAGGGALSNSGSATNLMGLGSQAVRENIIIPLDVSRLSPS